VNVLITSGASAVDVVRAFRDAATRRGGVVVLADGDPLAPAGVEAAVERIPPVHEPTYLSQLLDLVSRRKIRVLIPLGDDELPVLTGARSKFADLGCVVIASTAAFVGLADDKFATSQWPASIGLATTPTWLADDTMGVDLPEMLFVRPRTSSGSAGATRIRRDTLLAQPATDEEFVVQPFLDRPEVTIDCLFDLQGNPLHYVPRWRIVVEAGRAIRTTTVRRPAIDQWLTSVLPALGQCGARGPIGLQAFVVRDGLRLIEINARLSAGAALTFAAGAEYPELLLRMVEGKAVPPALGRYRAGMSMSTYPASVILEQPWWT
jgi:carbamoyl-phosphate synthase large subunit